MAPTNVAAAVEALAAEDNAYVLAGGTDLLVRMRTGLLAPRRIVDIKKIEEVCEIVESDTEFHIGAAVTGARISAHESLVSAYPGVVEAMDLIGSQQIQGRASPGGNLCNASPAADSVPGFIAAGATCLIVGPDGERSLPVEQIITGPGKTCLAQGEFVVRFILPKPHARTGDAYLRLIPRSEMDIAVVGAGACVTLDEEGAVIAAKIALGAVAPRPVVLAEVEELLVGGQIDDGRLANIEVAARAACSPIDDKRGTVEYRTKVAGVLARRVVLKAVERAKAR